MLKKGLLALIINDNFEKYSYIRFRSKQSARCGLRKWV